MNLLVSIEEMKPNLIFTKRVLFIKEPYKNLIIGIAYYISENRGYV